MRRYAARLKSLRTRVSTAIPFLARLELRLPDSVVSRLHSLQSRRRTIGLIASLSLHAMLLWLLLAAPPPSLQGGKSGRGDIGEDYAEVTLTAPMPELTSTTLIKLHPPEDVEALKPLPELAVDAKADLQSPMQPPSLQMPQLVAPAGMTSNESGKAGNPGDDLWSAIAPCWKRLADKDTQAVTLDVSFNASGGLSAPPVIERDLGASQDPKTLRSEATALAALSQCGNYAMVGGQKDLKINFPKP